MVSKAAIGASLFAVSVVASVSGPYANAALIANDNASDPVYSTWDPGDNGGTGWGGGWTFRNQSNIVLTATNGNRGWFVGNSINNNASGDSNGDGDINTASRAWGTYSNSTDHLYAVRPFSGALSVGQTVRFDMDNGTVSSGNVVGLRLISDVNDVNSRVFEFRFVGGQANYTTFGSAGEVATTIPFTREGVRGEFTLTSASTFSLKVTRLVDGTSATFTGGNVNSNPIAGLALRNQLAGSGGAADAFFNSLAIVPEPASVAVLGLLAVGSLARRRRA